MDSEIKSKTNNKPKTKTKSSNEKSNKKVQIIENNKSIWDDFQKEEKSLSTSFLLNNHYSTPQPIKLPKPSQKAFFSDGYESKKKKTRQSYQHTPKTPSKQYTLNSFSDVNLLTPTPNRSLKFTDNLNSSSGGSFSSPTSPTKSRSKLERLFSPHSDSSLSSPLPFYQTQFTINQNFDDPQSPIQAHKISYKNTSRILDKNYVEAICKTHIEKEIPKNTLQSDYLGSNFVDKHVIGHGSFAIVYKVKDLKDNKYYAVKVAKNPFHGEKDRINQLEEVNIWWKIGNNDHCVQLHQAWEQDGILHLQLDLCDGGSLQNYLETTGLQSTLPESQIWKILLDICKGLEHVHNLNIVHLDIKPANIFIKKSPTGDLILKIGDFGLARKCPVPPNTGLEGDKVYLAPEVLGDDGYTTSADIFSLGLILVEMASNNYLPDTGVYWQDLRKGNISLCENLDHSSLELLNLIKKMIDPNPNLRPTATEIMQIAEEQLEKFSECDLTEPLPTDLIYEMPDLPSSSSSSVSYTLSSSSSFIENDVEIIDDDTLPIKTNNKINEHVEEDDEKDREEEEEDEDRNKYFFKNKTKRKKRLSLNEFMITKEIKSPINKNRNKIKKTIIKDNSIKRKSNKSKIENKENTLISASHSNTKLISSGQQTLISDHFTRKKDEVKSVKTSHSITNHVATNNNTTNMNNLAIGINSNPQNNPNSPTSCGTEHQEVSLYYKQEKLSERRKTLDHLPKKENKKIVILDIGKGINKVKGNSKKRVKWKEWNKIIEFKDDSLNKEILFCNED